VSTRARAALVFALGGVLAATGAAGATQGDDAPAGLRASAQLAFDGRAPEGAATELALSLYARRGDEVRASILGAGAPVSLQARLEAGEPRTLHVPLRPAAGTDVLRVRVETAEGETRELEIAVERPAPGEARIAVAAANASSDAITRRLAGRPDARVVSLPASALPRSMEAYEAVDALVLDASAASGLDPAQAGALEAHLAACGRVVALAPGDRAAGALRAATGCRGAALTVVSTPSDAADAALVRTEAPPLPDPRALARATRPALGAARSVHAMLALSALGLVAAVALARSPLVPLALPVLAGALACAAYGWGGGVDADAVVWTVQEPGDAVARWSASLRLGGAGRGEVVLRGVPDPSHVISVAPPAALVRVERGDAGASFVARSGLLAPVDLALEGVTRADVGLALALEAGRPVVTAGAAATPAGALLSWRGQLWPVPALDAGERWTPGETPSETPRAEALGTVLRETGLVGGPPVLLVPFVPAAAAELAREGAARGWLLIKASGRGADA
jgi:hypothetical protein